MEVVTTKDGGSPEVTPAPGTNWVGWASLGWALLAWVSIAIFVVGPWNGFIYLSFVAMLAAIVVGMAGFRRGRRRDQIKWPAVLGLALSLILAVPFLQTLLFVFLAG